MKIKKKYRFIEIKTKDLGEYTDIAVLVDNKYFLEEVERVRRKFGFNYEYPPKDTKKIYFEYEYELYKNSKLKKKFEAEVERIRKIYNRPPHFFEAIKASIIYGIIGARDYSKACLEEQEITPIKDPYETSDMRYCIVIHSGTRKKDIIRVFDEFREKVRINFRGTKKERSKYKYGYWFDPSLAKIGDTKNSIQQISNWYRRRINGESPLRIALKDSKFSYKQYRKMVHIYKKWRKPDGEKVSRQVFDENYEQLEEIEKYRDNIKEQLKRYRKLLKSF